MTTLINLIKKSIFTIIYSFYHYLRSAGAHFPAEEGEKRRPVNTNPDAVDSQREADEIAMAIQMSLNEEKQKEKQKQEQKQPVRILKNIIPSMYTYLALIFALKKLRTFGKLTATISSFSFRIGRFFICHAQK